MDTIGILFGEPYKIIEPRNLFGVSMGIIVRGKVDAPHSAQFSLRPIRDRFIRQFNGRATNQRQGTNIL